MVGILNRDELHETIGSMKTDLNYIKAILEAKLVSKSRFELLERFVYGSLGFTATFVCGLIISGKLNFIFGG